MDNITHTLAGALIGEMGLKRKSRFAMAACLLGANAPDIDVFAPLVLPVDGIAFHRGPLHSVFALPFLAAGVVAILWLVDRIKPRHPDTLPFRPAALFVVAFLAVLTHPFLDWLTTYAIAIFAPAEWRWYSGDAIFIVDWVYWILLVSGIVVSARRWRRSLPNPGRPACVAGAAMLLYIAANLTESVLVERATADELHARGIAPVLIVSGPPPFTFWDRTIAWRSAERFGSGTFTVRRGLSLQPAALPIGLNNSRLADAMRTRRYVRSFLIWSRMPIVVTINGQSYLTDQRFYNAAPAPVAGLLAKVIRRTPFLIPLDKP